MDTRWDPRPGRPPAQFCSIITQSHAHVCVKVKTEFHDMNCFTCLLDNIDEASLVTFVTLSKEILLHNA